MAQQDIDDFRSSYEIFQYPDFATSFAIIMGFHMLQERWIGASNEAVPYFGLYVNGLIGSPRSLPCSVNECM